MISFLRNWLLAIILAGLALMPSSAADLSPADEYLRIYDRIVEADGLNAAGKTDLARAKYLQVQKELVKFRDANPGWNPEVVSYRLGELATKLAAAPAKAGTNVSAAAEVS